jgi:FlaA1/EpsC-like NDP-sugar epimerase
MVKGKTRFLKERLQLIAPFKDESVVILGGTGSLGKVLVERLIQGKNGSPKSVTVFSRDEDKQHDLRLKYLGNPAETDSAIYKSANEKLRFIIGDVRNPLSLKKALEGSSVVIYAAAMKQVPSCEYFPSEAVYTNVLGAENALNAAYEAGVKTFVGVSTDKAVAPVNVLGMTKALQERLVIQSNLRNGSPRAVAVRYGNVLSSRGSVIPLFKDQISKGAPLTITDSEMTRFLLTLDDAVDMIVDAIIYGDRGDILVPSAPSAKMIDLAGILSEKENPEIVFIGRRPGEKIHELLVSEEEGLRTERLGEKCFRIKPALPELLTGLNPDLLLNRELSSADFLMSIDELRKFLTKRGVI